ncbi:MAG TPA: MlaD family protein [Steroidobacteraceae bacterium]|nr:MlaD family protein [Steroidobacteraceae bacterium]
MDRDANYVAVGAFVLLIVVIAAAFVYWYAGRGDKHAHARYEIYFHGSVSGLTDGSPVRYLGVDVGKVSRIMLDPLQPKRVRVVADIDSSAPIDSRTLASLSLQGVTGLLFIDLEQDDKAAAARPLTQGLHYPVIRSAPSNFDVLLANLPVLTTRAVELVNRLNEVFSEANVRALDATLDDARLASDRLPATIRSVRQLSDAMRASSQEVQRAAAELRAIAADSAPDIRRSAAHLRQVADNLASTTERLDRFVADNEPGMSRFTRKSLPEFEQLLRESRGAARDFRDLSRSLRENPSQLLYEPKYSGVKVAR